MHCSKIWHSQTQLQYHDEPHSTPLDATAAEYIPSSQHEQMHESTAAAKDEQVSEQSDINQHDIANSATGIMQNWNKLVIDQQKRFSLPPREVTPFDGSPLESAPFWRSFQHCIEDKTESSKDRLYYLEQFTKGQPNELVRSCMLMDADEGYEEAKRLLKRKYGKDYKITSAYMTKAANCRQIEANNGRAMNSYAVFLRSCSNTMKTLESMKEMDHPKNIKTLVEKLPEKFMDRWRRVVFNKQEKEGKTVKFDDVVKFVEEQAEIATDPVYGNDTEPRRKPEDLKRHYKGQYRPPRPRSVFSTTTKAPTQDKTPAYKPCMYCRGDHTMEMCR